MSALAELLMKLRGFSRIIVCGPQRAGTTVAAKILAEELRLAFIPEEDVNIAELACVYGLCRSERSFVLQAPALSYCCHLLPFQVVFMRRNVKDIIASQIRVGWTGEDRERLRYCVHEKDFLPIASIKYGIWDHWQKNACGGMNLDYESLRSHRLWVSDRGHFHIRQTECTQKR